jgi:hypothetical protein
MAGKGSSQLISHQCCQMAYFQTKNTNLGKFWKVLHLKMLIFFTPFFYFTAKWYILWSFCIFCMFWYFAPRKIWQPCPGCSELTNSQRNLFFPQFTVVPREVKTNFFSRRKTLLQQVNFLITLFNLPYLPM